MTGTDGKPAFAVYVMDGEGACVAGVWEWVDYLYAVSSPVGVHTSPYAPCACPSTCAANVRELVAGKLLCAACGRCSCSDRRSPPRSMQPNHTGGAYLSEFPGSYDFIHVSRGWRLADAGPGACNHAEAMPQLLIRRFITKWLRADSHHSRCIPPSRRAQPDQVQWYNETSMALEKAAGRKVPGVAFTHIPMPEYDSAFICNLPANTTGISIGTVNDFGAKSKSGMGKALASK